VTQPNEPDVQEQEPVQRDSGDAEDRLEPPEWFTRDRKLLDYPIEPRQEER